MSDALRIQKRVSESIELELQAAVHYHVGREVLETGLRFSGRAASTLNY